MTSKLHVQNWSHPLHHHCPPMPPSCGWMPSPVRKAKVWSHPWPVLSLLVASTVRCLPRRYSHFFPANRALMCFEGQCVQFQKMDCNMSQSWQSHSSHSHSLPLLQLGVAMWPRPGKQGPSRSLLVIILSFLVGSPHTRNWWSTAFLFFLPGMQWCLQL